MAPTSYTKAPLSFQIAEDYRILSWSKQLEAMFGRRAAEAIGRPCYEVIAASLSNGAPFCGPGCAQMQAFREGLISGATHCRARRLDGSSCEFEMGASPLRFAPMVASIRKRLP